MTENAISLGPQPRYQQVASPRQLWPREADFAGWLASNLDALGACLELGPLAPAGREVPAGEQVLGTDITGRLAWMGGLRMDITARNEHERHILIEASSASATMRTWASS